MTVLPIAPNQPEVMTGRARVYLAIAALRHLLIGGSAVLIPGSFQSTSFVPLREVLPLQVWGVVFLFAAVVCVIAALTRNEFFARLGLIMSATTTAVWAAGITMAWITGDLASPTGPIVWWAIAGKDFVMCAQPMRSPFEPLVRAARERDDVRRRS